MTISLAAGGRRRDGATGSGTFDALSTSQAPAGLPPERVARVFALRFLAGGGAGMLVVLFVLLGGELSLLQRNPSGLMYDAQARSLFDGRWDLPRAVSSIETFTSHGKDLIYFGPFPAVLRMPLLAVTHQFDGRLSQLSMLVAFLVVLAGSTLVVSEVVRQCDLTAPNRLGRWLFAVLGFVVMGGSVVTFLAFRGDVYNEAIAWGLATSVASIAMLLRGLRTGSIRVILLAGVMAAAAIESRITMGISATAAIGFALCCTWRRHGHHLRERTPPLLPGVRTALAGGIAIPTVVFLAVQVDKWHSLLVVPSQHVVNQSSSQFAAYVANNGDTYFSARFLPTNVLASVFWPPAVRWTSVFPWIDRIDTRFGPSPGHPIFLGRSWTGSLAFTQTLLFGLAVVGASALLVRTIAGRRAATACPSSAPPYLGMIMIGASLGFVGTLAYSYQYQRFLADALPVVLLGAVMGAATVAGSVRAPWARRSSIGAALVLALWSLWMNGASALLAQTSRAFAPSAAAVQQLTRIQADLGAVPTVITVGSGAPLPPPARVGTLAAVGACEALFVSAGTEGFGPTWWAGARGAPYKRAQDVDPQLVASTGTATIAAEGSTSVSVTRDAEGRSEIVIVAADQRTKIVLGHGMRRITLEVRPVWSSMSVTAEGRTLDVPWNGDLSPTPFTGTSGITDRGADDMSTCRNALDAGD